MSDIFGADTKKEARQDALDTLRLYIKKHYKYATIKPKLIVYNGTVVRVEIDMGNDITIQLQKDTEI